MTGTENSVSNAVVDTPQHAIVEEPIAGAIIDTTCTSPEVEHKIQGVDPVGQRQHDIYRGAPTTFALDGADDISENSSSSSSSIGPLGALAAAVELAITRWAKIHSDGSSTTSSSSSSSGSTTKRTSVTRRRKSRRYSASASLFNIRHERAFYVRKKAREECKLVSREFTLLLPFEASDTLDKSQTSSGMHPNAIDNLVQQRVVKTTSMSLVLSHLDSALRKSAKLRRNQERSTHSSDLSDYFHDRSHTPSSKGTGKGKIKKSDGSLDERAGTTQPRSFARPSRSTDLQSYRKTWWLDVASPTWDDMRSIGKILHLHPLTLEDILHQDPREKLELFPRLGYYFVVFRALESELSRQRFRRLNPYNNEVLAPSPDALGNDDILNAVNVYMVVFKEGICTFHFEDISEHTDKLRNKVLRFEDSIHMSSDWIAHGLLDSIVDSFFPALSAIEKETKSVDALILESPSNDNEHVPSEGGSVETVSDIPEEINEKSISTQPPNPSTVNLEKLRFEGTIEKPFSRSFSKRFMMGFSNSLPTVVTRCGKRLASILVRMKIRGNKKVSRRSTQRTYTTRTLARMATTRRLVTSLGRLLGTKGDVLAQIRKRLLTSSDHGYNSGLGAMIPDSGEVAIYMGDIQDHIVTLQQSLAHYERMLSHSHPAYLSQLRVSQSVAKSGTDNAILLLTVISIIVLCIQMPLGLFSMNIKVPTNRHPDGTVGGPYNIFFIILSVALVICVSVLLLVRHWLSVAKRKFSRAI